MTDITSSFDLILQRFNVHVNKHPHKSSDTTDEFTKEAYRICANIASVHGHLQSIRQPYLSISHPPHRNRLSIDRTKSSASDRSVFHQRHQSAEGRTYFTDTQRDQIDAESKATLRDLSAGIWQLEEAEKLRRDTEITLSERKKARNGFKALGQWASGGTGSILQTWEEALEAAQQETIKLHRESIIWYLRKKLGETAELQSGMMQTRLDREIEKSKSVLYKTKGAADISASMAALEQEHISATTNQTGPSRVYGGSHHDSGLLIYDTQPSIEQTLSPEQLQLFAQENTDMLKHYEDTLDKVRIAERSMIEISELQTTLAANLETQSVMIDDLVLQSLETHDDVAGGNKELKRAAERKGPAQWVFRASCGLCAFLILWDFFI